MSSVSMSSERDLVSTAVERLCDCATNAGLSVAVQHEQVAAARCTTFTDIACCVRWACHEPMYVVSCLPTSRYIANLLCCGDVACARLRGRVRYRRLSHMMWRPNRGISRLPCAVLIQYSLAAIVACASYVAPCSHRAVRYWLAHTLAHSFTRLLARTLARFARCALRCC